jgi:hypothetical protein
LGAIEIITRLANPPEDLVSKYPRKQREFFFDYSRYVLRLIDSQWVREKLGKLVELENIHVNKTIDLRVMVFPARPLRGRPRSILHGSYNQESAQISLYPLKLSGEWIRREGFSMFKTPVQDLSPTQRKIFQEASLSAISTLIHEVLHVKFETRTLSRYVEEAIVRKLERQYAQEWLETLPDFSSESYLLNR